MRQGFCFCGCFVWFQVQSDVPENVKAFARALRDAQLEGQILKTETGSFKLEQVGTRRSSTCGTATKRLPTSC